MICPKCGVDGQQMIIDTRHRSSDYILRRRQCVCGHRFNSIEIIELNEKVMKVIEREMIKNCKPRAFECIIDKVYRSIFDRWNYLKEKRESKAS